MRLLVGRSRPVADPVVVPAATLRTETVVAYSEDCVLRGTITFEGSRLTDALSTLSDLTFGSVTVRALDDGRVVELPELVVDLDEICCLAAPSPRGDVARRIRTRPELVLCGVGPFGVLGYMHAPPTADPTVVLSRRRFAPLTQATLAMPVPGGVEEVLHDVLLVNRRHVRSIQTDVGPAAAAPGALLPR